MVAVLNLYLLDALDYWLEQPPRNGGKLQELKQAYDDLMLHRVILNRLCDLLNMNPDYVVRKFKEQMRNDFNGEASHMRFNRTFARQKSV